MGFAILELERVLVATFPSGTTGLSFVRSLRARPKTRARQMAEELDPVARYGMGLGLAVRNRTVLVEGTTDAELFHLAARLEREATGLDLLGTDLAILAAGSGDLGGTRGVIRELVCLRGLARVCLL